MDKGVDKIEDKQGRINNEQMIMGVVDQIVDSACIQCMSNTEPDGSEVLL